MIQLVELFLGDVEKMLFKAGFREFGSSCTVYDVMAIIGSFAVVKQCEQPHHHDVGICFLGEQQSIAFHLFPMDDAMHFRDEEAMGEDEGLEGG